MEGEFLADALNNETSKWLETHQDQYVGYQVDVSKNTKQTALEHKKMRKGMPRKINPASFVRISAKIQPQPC